MDQLDVKKLKKLADACRKAGIKTFKGHGYEFTLSDDVPQPKRTKSASAPYTTSDEEIETDSISQEELLFWSSGQASSQAES